MLASGSAARRAMLAAAGVEFRVMVPEVDEDAAKARGGSAREIAMELANVKALTSTSLHDADRAELVIGSDQTLEFDGRTVSKAASLSELRDNLIRLRGRTHTLHSAVAAAKGGEVVWTHIASAHLTMRVFSDAFLEDYLARHGDKVRSSLGGYWFEAEGAQMFDAVDGDYFTILGMPLLPLLGFLREAGALAS
jgi:septum formation protein